jgi:hypothetical protein
MNNNSERRKNALFMINLMIEHEFFNDDIPNITDEIDEDQVVEIMNLKMNEILHHPEWRDRVNNMMMQNISTVMQMLSGPKP